MFNLVQGIECIDGTHTFQLARIYSNDLPRPSTSKEFELRARLPTIVMEEGAPSTDQRISLVKLSNFVMGPKEVSFYLRPDPEHVAFPASILDENKYRHSLRDSFSWHHTCWQYGDSNIFETLFKAGNDTKTPNQPKIFNLSQPTKTDFQKVACMMPFATEFDDVYTTIKEVCSEVGLNSLRIDEIYNNTMIIEDVVEAIDTARVVVCDLTGRNPNVLYETGISHALGREVVILAQNIKRDVPFDLSHLRCIEYSGAN